MDPANQDDRNKQLPRVNLVRSLKDAIAEVQQIKNGLQRYIEKAERLLWELCVIERALQDRGGYTSPRRPTRVVVTPIGPAPAAHDCRLEWLPNGKPAIRVDNEKQVTLSATLALLVAVLASDEGQSPDEFVAWKSLDQIGELLQKESGRLFDRQSVSNLLWRLRGKLGGAGLDPRLIESSPALGARLRLKRHSTGPCAT